VATKYPSGIDDNLSLPRAIDLVTPVKAEVVNDLRDTIITIENELGIDPSREFGTVRARLDAITDLIGTGGVSGGSVAVQDEGSTVLTTAKTLNFIGANVSVTDAGSCQADIEINCDIQVVQETIIVNPLDVNTFTLSTTPSDADTVQMFVNGAKQKYGTDYTVSGDTVTFISPDLTMLTTFDVEFFYVVTGGIAYQESPTVSLSQTVFTLDNDPINGSVVQMYINGQKQQYGTDYTVTDTTVTYSGSLILSGTDDVEFWYISAAAVCGGQGGGGSGELFVKDEGVQVDGYINCIDFVGAGVTVTSLTPGEVIVTIPGGGSGGNETLAQTLVLGNTTGGTDIELTAGDVITSASSVDLEVSGTTRVSATTTETILSNNTLRVTPNGTDDRLTVSDAQSAFNHNINVTGDGYVSGNFEIAGKLTVGGIIDPTGMVYDLQASAPEGTPSANKSTMWIRNDGYVVVTDEFGVDNVLAYTFQTGTGGEETLAETLAFGNTTGGNDIVVSSGDIITSEPNSTLNILTTGIGGSSDSITIDTGDATAVDGNASGSIMITTGDVQAGASGGTTSVGSLFISGGANLDTTPNQLAGLVIIGGGTSSFGNGGGVSVSGGTGGAAGSGGGVTISGGPCSLNTPTGDGGIVNINGGLAGTGGTDGAINLNVSNDLVASFSVETLDSQHDGYVLAWNEAGQYNEYVDPVTMGADANAVHESVAVTVPNQTSFTISDIPVSDSLIMFTDKLKVSVDDFSVIGTTVTYTGAVPLDPGDEVEFYYLTSANVVSLIDLPDGQSFLEGTLTTADDTETTLANIGTSTGTVIFIDAVITALDTGNDAASWNIQGAFKNIAGTVTQFGNGNTFVQFEERDDANWNVTFDINR